MTNNREQIVAPGQADRATTINTGANEQAADKYEKLRIGALNVIKCFALRRSADNKKGETLLIVVDTGADDMMIQALHEAGQEIAGADCRIMVVPETEHAAQGLGSAVGDKMSCVDAVLLVTSLSRTHSQESAELLHPEHSPEIIERILNSPNLHDSFLQILMKYSAQEIVEKINERRIHPDSAFPAKARLISITNTNWDTFTEGASQEDPLEMSVRIDRFAEIMDGVEKVKAVTGDGNILEVDLKRGSLMKETGIIDKPGQASNFPTGEYGGSVDLAGTNGVFEVRGAVGMIGPVDQPIIITIENGVAVKIEGGESARQLRGYLEKANREYRILHPEDTSTDAFKVAEFSFGMNSKAFRLDGNGRKICPTTSLEAEKWLGTFHVALGKNTLFNLPPDDPDRNPIPIHIDCVCLNSTVMGIKEDGEEMELIRNGEVVCL